MPKGALDNKPPHGSPCTRCGACCMATPCPLSQHLFKIQSGPCPALMKEADGTYTCGVVKEVEDDELRHAALLLIGSGLGCDARFNGEWTNTEFHRKCDRWDRDHHEQIKAARQLWGMKDG